MPSVSAGGRVLGLDLGDRRIGVALSDSRRTLASPRGFLERHGDRRAEHAEVAAVVEEEGATLVVVGMPVSLDGRKGPAARRVEGEVEELRSTLGVPVETQDERLSTVTASRAMSGAGRPARRQRHVIDGAAAAVLLQAWLDRGGGLATRGGRR